MQSVYIAIPSLDGRIHIGTFMSVLQTVTDLNAEGISCNVESYVGDSLITSTRNILLAKFLNATDCTDMLCVDADVSWGAGTAQRILSHQTDFVGGLYRFKNDVEGYPMQCLPDPEEKGLWAIDPKTGQIAEDGLIEVAAVPMGFVRITRKAVQEMFDAYGARKYEPKDVPGLEARCLFDIPFENGQLIGEDYTFCHRYRAIGGKVYFDPWLKLDHTGQKTFKGDAAHWLRNRHTPQEPDAPKSPNPETLERLRETFAKTDYKGMFETALGEHA